jgi:hypothetical protein
LASKTHPIRLSSAGTVKYDTSLELNTTLHDDDVFNKTNEGKFQLQTKSPKSSSSNKNHVNNLKDDPYSIKLWKSLMEHVNNKNYNKAYEQVLTSGMYDYMMKTMISTS